MGNRPSYPLVDLSGKVALVTGGNTGIGYEISKALAEMGAHTFMACKLQEGAAPANDAIDRMKSEVGEEKELKVEYLLVDLASFSSVKDFVRTFKEKNLPLHILVNNAGVCAVPFSVTENGFDLQFQVNYLSALLLTLELLPNMMEASSVANGDARIVFMSSSFHQTASWDPDHFNPVEEGYHRLKTYGQTKLYYVMLAAALQRRLRDFNITVSSVEPGYVRTDLKQSFEDHTYWYYGYQLVMAFMSQSAKQGAVSAVNCAVNPDLNTGQAFHYYDCRQKEPNSHASNELYQEDLWRKSLTFLKEHLSNEVVEKYSQ